MNRPGTSTGSWNGHRPGGSVILPNSARPSSSWRAPQVANITGQVIVVDGGLTIA